MNSRQTLRYERLEGVILFLDRHARVLGPELAAARDRLIAYRDEAKPMRFRPDTQTTLHAQRTAAGLRAALREKQMIPLARQVRRAFRGDPAMRASMRVPHKNASADSVVAAARRMVKALAPHMRGLERVHINPLRVTRLRQGIAQLEKQRSAAKAAPPKRRRDTRAAQDILSRVRDDLVAIDGTIRAEAPPAVVADWIRAFRLPKKLGRPTKREVERRKRNRPPE